VALGIVFTTIVPLTSGTAVFELLKLIIQFLLIVVLGAAAAIGVELVKRRLDFEARQRQDKLDSDARWRQYEIDTLTSLLARFDDLYQTIKRDRRSLSVMQLATLTFEGYVTIMSDLSDRKRDAERIWRDIQVIKEWIPELEGVEPRGKLMESYFDGIDKEYRSVSTAPENFRPEQLPALRLFRARTGSGEASNFHLLRTPYYEARDALIKLLAQKRTGSGPKQTDVAPM
jgi:hypothetical protein